MKILLVEPNYKNKYPPLGLMKISTYHKSRGDEVHFIKGTLKDFQSQKWDRIYISTLFTFYYKLTLNTILYYIDSAEKRSDIFVGGPMATIMKKELDALDAISGVRIVGGLLDEPGVLGNDDVIIDELVPDYTIIEREINTDLDYRYPVDDSYFLHITHGCIRKCVFCAVPVIEPKYIDCTEFSSKLMELESIYGPKRYLKVMDNNILASNRLDYIVDELVKLGYGRNNKSFRNNRRWVSKTVDFNQGLDARLLYNDPKIMTLLSKLEIKPMRVAFDHAQPEFVKMYVSVMRQAAQNNVHSLSNYVLFNLDDTPQQLYDRLKINTELNKEFEDQGFHTSIWSFPMKYSPIFGEHSTDRKHIGKNWNKKYLRSLQCILIPTHGVVGPKLEYFNHAFGASSKEFEELLVLPEKYILNRDENFNNGKYANWTNLYAQLDENEKSILIDILSTCNKKQLRMFVATNKSKLSAIIELYL